MRYGKVRGYIISLICMMIKKTVYNVVKTQFSVADSVPDMKNWNFSASTAEDAEDSR